MAIVAMTDAVPGGTAAASEYNKLIDNILDLDTRLTILETGVFADTIGSRVADTGNITTDSNTWNSSAKIITNLSVTFPAINGAIYQVDVDAVGSMSIAGYLTCGVIVKNGGTPGAGDDLKSYKTVRADTATALYDVSQHAYFTAAATATYGVALFGWIQLGGGIGNLEGAVNQNANRLVVKRVN